MYILISFLITSVSVVKSHIWLSPCEVGEIHWVQFLSTARLGQDQAVAWDQLAPVFLLSTEKHQLIFSVVRAEMWKDEQTCAWLLRLETSQCQFHPHCMDQNVPLSKPHMRGLGDLGVWLYYRKAWRVWSNSQIYCNVHSQCPTMFKYHQLCNK